MSFFSLKGIDMKVFLTSSPSGPLDQSRHVDGLDDKNEFVVKLQSIWKENSRCLIISAFPENWQANDEMTTFFHWAMNHRGLSCSMDLWDTRYGNFDIQTYDVIILGGGHVPTQNKFFETIQLKEKIKNFHGIIIGISAGSMNAAQIVYSQPEEPGEAIDPHYQRYLKGLDLTTTQMIPHYQMIKQYWLDGLRLFEDITYKESLNREFVCLVDGSYIFIDNNKEWIYGESYLIKDGLLIPFSKEDEVVLYKENGVRI